MTDSKTQEAHSITDIYGNVLTKLNQIRFSIGHVSTIPTEESFLEMHNILLEIVDYLDTTGGK